MNIVVKLEQRDFEGNKAVFDQLYGLSAVINKVEKAEAGTIIPKADVEKAAKIETDIEPEDEPINNPVDEQPDSAADEQPTYTIEQVRQAFGDLSKSKGKDAAKGILSDLGVSKVTDIPETMYAKAMSMVKAVS